MKNVKRMSILVLTAVLLLAVAAPVSADDAAAPDQDPAPAITGDGVRRFFNGVLVRTFRYQVSMTEFIGQALEDVDGTVERAENRIEELEEQGKDIDQLEMAIDEFETLLDQAASDHSAAQSIVDLHSGFDEDGMVEELDEAQETVRAIEPYLTAARQNIIDAIRTIHEALQDYQEANTEA